MRRIFKSRIFQSIFISILMGGSFFYEDYSLHKDLKNNGVATKLYVKSLNSDETTFWQRAKYTKCASTYFVTQNGDTISEISKNFWGMGNKILFKFNFYAPIDSVIYNKNSPLKKQLIRDFRAYSLTYSILGHGIFTPLFFSFLFFQLFRFWDKIKYKSTREIAEINKEINQ